MDDLCEILVRVASDKTPLIQQVYMAAGHALCEIVERELAKSTDCVGQYPNERGQPYPRALNRSMSDTSCAPSCSNARCADDNRRSVLPPNVTINWQELWSISDIRRTLNNFNDTPNSRHKE